MKPDPAEELSEARTAARHLLSRGLSADVVAKRLGGQFFICLYAARGKLFASFTDGKGKEQHTRLSVV